MFDIKPLKWNKAKSGRREVKIYEAKTPFGIYRVDKFEDEINVMFLWIDLADYDEFLWEKFDFETIEKAKAYCEKDYTQKMKKCLVKNKGK